MTANRVGDFLRRDWALISLATAGYWRDWKREHGPAGGIRMADELRRQVIEQRPGWPSEAERDEDLATHLRVAKALRHGGNPRTH